MKCAKMKVGLGALAVVTGLAVALLGLTKAGGLAEVAWKNLCGVASDSVPIDVEIQRISLEIEKLTIDIKTGTSSVIKEEVATDRLRDEVKTTKANLEKRLTLLTQMKAALDSGDSKVVFGGETFTASKMRAKFTQDWESYKSAEAAVKSKEALIEQRQKQIDTARARIDEMKAQQDQLRTEVAKMQADLEAAKLAQAQSQVSIDESRLAGIKASIKDVKIRTEVLVREAKEQGNFVSTAPSIDEAVKSVNAENEFDVYVGNKVKTDK